MKKKAIIIIVLAGIVCLITLKLISNKRTLNEKNQPAPVSNIRIPVKIAPVATALQEISIVKTGNLAPFKEAKALAITSGTLQQLHFELGDMVKQGQVLAIVDTRTAQLQLQKAESNAAKLRNDLDTYTELLAGKAATQEKVNQLRQDYQDAVNQVEQTRKSLADGAIKAPTSGMISSKSVELGVFVNAGTEIASIVNLSKAKVQVNLTENEVYKVTKGQAVKITTDVYAGKTFSGTISFISPQADASHNYLVEILIDNSGETLLRSGTFVYADFSRKTQQQVMLIPREALTESVKNAAVYVVENGIAHLRTIQTGGDMGGNIQVLDGLHAGEQVVVSGQINLKDGIAVSESK